DRRYQDRGFVPWVDYRVGRSAYDPIFAYYRQTFDREWERGVRNLYGRRLEGEADRPPRTFRQGRPDTSVLAPLSQVKELRVTALASLAGERRPREAAVIRLQPVAREQRA